MGAYKVRQAVSFECDSRPPARGRGLKLFFESAVNPALASPPARGRGLKQLRVRLQDGQQVAPRAGAWIETSAARNPGGPAGRPPRGGVD